MNKIIKLSKKSSLVFMLIIAIVGIIGITTAYASYTHILLAPWGSSYQTATYKVQDTFSDLTKSQISNAIVHWNAQLTKSFLYKSSIDTTETTPSRNGVKTITKNYYGADSFIAEHIPYYDTSLSYVVESDIRVNTYYSYANSAQPDKYDIQSIITHELGHALRVGHSTITSDTMYAYPSQNSEAWRTVTSADKEAARASTSRWFN